MRLLIINFEMDEDSGVLAWQASVARELARHCESVHVLTERLGRFVPPENMRVDVMPKRNYGVPKRFGGNWLANARVAALCRRERIDACFIHMSIEWTYYLYPTFRLLGIPVLLWYAHGVMPFRVRLAVRSATRVVTSTPEGCRIESNKVYVIGQGVDTDLFDIPDRAAERNDLVYTGRVSERKRIGLLLDVMEAIARKAPGSPIRLRVIGPALTAEDAPYEARMRERAAAKGGRAEIMGFLPQRETPPIYKTAFLHINVSRTGSMDKTVVEALACGCPVLTANEAFFDFLKPFPEFIIRDESPESIADRVLELHARRDAYDPKALRALVVGSHDQHAYAKKLMAHLKEIAGEK